jgi:ectoine hydroxylase-related dioxygenase (phytanoyl-CoA dioxygenase family)
VDKRALEGISNGAASLIAAPVTRKEQSMLTDRHVAEYQTKGFAVAEGLFTEQEIGELRRVTDELIVEASALTSPTPTFELEPSHAPEQPAVRRIEMPHRHFDFFREFVRHPALIDSLQKLIGPDVRVHNSKINLKPGRIGSPVEWHQDWCFYPHTNDAFLTVGVFLDDITSVNGPLLCLPGSHQGKIYDHHNPDTGYFCSAVDLDADPVNATGAEECVGPAGTVSFHHVRTMHASGPNMSAQARRLLLIGYAAADAWPLLGVRNWDQYEADMVCGRSTRNPRMVALPCPVPFPMPPEAQERFSLFDNQKRARRLLYDRPAEVN